MRVSLCVSPRMFGCKIAIAAIFAAISLVPAHAVEVVVNPTIRYQTIDGWGTHMSAADPQTLLDYRDLGMNLVRIYLSKNVLVDSSGDYSIPVTLGADLQANINKFNFSAGGMDGAAAAAAWLRANALEPDRVKIVADCWSPPHWMKGPTGKTQQWVGNPSGDSPWLPTPWLSNNYNHWYKNGPPGNPHYLGNSGDSIGGRLKTEDPNTLQQYGRYMASWVAGFEQHYGVPLYAISLQNESSFENPFDSMTYTVGPNGTTDYTQYAKGLKAVRDAWQQFGLTTKIDGPHVANVGPTPDNPWALLSQMKMIQAVKSDSDPTLANFLSFYSSNGYMGTSEAAVKAIAGYYHGSANVPANWAFWTYAPGIEQDHKPVWFSEAGDGDGSWRNGPNGTPGDGAITVAQKIHSALVEGNVSAYIYWQFTDGNANPAEYNLLGTNQIANPLTSKKYCAFKQFSRFIRPGAQRITANFLDTGTPATGGASQYDTYNSVDASAYINDLDHTFTVVLINMKAGDAPLTLDVPASLGIAALDAYRTSDTENFAQLAAMLVQGGHVSFNLPGYSVMTLTASVVGIRVWNGGTGNWSAASKWTPNGAPAAGDTLQFGGASGTATNDIPGTPQYASLTFNAGAGSFILAGNGIKAAGPITNGSSNDQTISMPVELTSGAGAGVIDTGSRKIAITATLTPTVGLTKNGTGELELSRTLTSATTTTVQEGKLTLIAGVAAGIEGTGSLVVANGSTSASAQVFADHIRQTSLTIGDKGKVTITGGGGSGGTSVIGSLTIALPGNSLGILDENPVAVPEPGTLALLAVAGLLSLLARSTRLRISHQAVSWPCSMRRVLRESD